MPSPAFLPPPAPRSTRFGIPTSWAVAAGLLMAAVLLLVFGTLVRGYVNQADRARAAEAMRQRERMDCEQHALAVTRRDCKQQVAAANR